MLMPFVLAALLRVIVVTDHWLYCAGLFTICFAVGGFLYSAPVGQTLLMSGLALVLSSIYFFLLTRMNTRARWWAVAILGFPIALI